MSEDTVIRFCAAIEAGDIDAVREIYAPDAVIWHIDDLIEQPVDENLKVLAGLQKAVSGLHYEIIRRAPADDGVVQPRGAQRGLRSRRGRGANLAVLAYCRGPG